QVLLQTGDIPLLGQAVGRHVLGNRALHHVIADRLDGLFHGFGGKNLVALGVDHLALLVGDVVVFQQLLADVEVAAFDLALGLLDGIGDHAVLDRLALLHAQRLHEVLHPIGGEDAHEVVFQRQIEPAGTRVALTAGATTQLVVDTTGLMAFAGNDVQAAGVQHLLVALLPLGLDLVDLLGGRVFQAGELRLPAAAEDDVGTTSGHVGGEVYWPRATGLVLGLRL